MSSQEWVFVFCPHHVSLSSLSFPERTSPRLRSLSPSYPVINHPRPMLIQTVSVDVDLGAEASSSQLCRVSRRHALIKLKCDGEFYIKNIGKRPLDVNGRPVWRGTKCRLPHDSVIEIANIFLLFSINTPAMAKIKQQLRSSMTG